MHLDFFTVLSTVFSLFILIGVGYGALKLNILGQESKKVFTGLLMNITLPCTLLVSLADREYDPSFLLYSLIMIGMTLVIHLVEYILCLPLIRLFRIPEGCRGVWIFNAVFGNYVFIGFPIILALFGEEALSLAAMIALIGNMLHYTAGISLIVKDSGEKRAGNTLLQILSPANIAILLSLLLYFCRISLPDTILQPVRYLSNVTTPLSMLMTGLVLGSQSGKKLFADARVWTCTLLRLAVFPLLTLLAVKLIPFPHPLIAPVLCVIIAMPCAAVGTVLAEAYNGDRELSARNVFLSSLLSVFTIPLYCLML